LPGRVSDGPHREIPPSAEESASGLLGITQASAERYPGNQGGRSFRTGSIFLQAVRDPPVQVRTPGSWRASSGILPSRTLEGLVRPWVVMQNPKAPPWAGDAPGSDNPEAEVSGDSGGGKS